MKTADFGQFWAEIAEFWVVSPTNSNLYHYAGNNPLKYIDPDGEKTVKSTSRIGQKAHTFFEDQLSIILVGEQNTRTRYAQTDRPLKRILNFLFGLAGVETRNQEILAEQDPAVDELSSPLKRPDLTVTNNETKVVSVYELKPDSCKSGYKNEKAKAQIEGYIAELSKNTSGFTVKGGTDIPSGLTLPYLEEGLGATITFTADPSTPGLYYYSIDDGQ